jgi:Protein of unknown function (DUF3551)
MPAAGIRETTAMRTILAALALAALGLAGGGAPGHAEITYPWCAQYGEQSGARNCGFSTLEQCRAAISGNGGYCEQNAMYSPGVGTAPAPHRRR